MSNSLEYGPSRPDPEKAPANMDDTPDKLRRNVVVLCAAILAIALFNLSFRPTGTLLGFAEIGNLNAFKVWLALAATLVYLYLRWRYAVDTEKELDEVKQLFGGLRVQAIKERIALQVRANLMHGRGVTILDGDDELLDDELADRVQMYGRPSYVDAVIGLRKIEGEPWWTGQAGINLFLQWPNGQQYGRRGGNMLDFSLDRRSRAAALTISVWRAAVGSRLGVDIAVPFVLSGLALLVCMFKMAFFFPAW